MRAMILAAGLGSRLRPLTNYRAKPALPVQGRPVVSLLLELLAHNGVDQVLINLHHLPETIRDAVAGDHPEGMTIRWSEEPRPLGTGGGIRRAAGFLSGSDDCIVMAGDMLLDVDLSRLLALHRRSGRDVTLILREDSRGRDFGTIGIDARGLLTRIGKREVSQSSDRDRSVGPEQRKGLFTGVRFFSNTALSGWPTLDCPQSANAAQDAAQEVAFEDLRDWLAPRIEAGEILVGAEIVDGTTSVWEPVGTPAEYLDVNLCPPCLPSLGGDVKTWGGDLRPSPTEDGNVIAGSAEVPADASLDHCVVWDRERVPDGFRGRDGVYAGNAFHPCRSPE
ncbi:MAG: NTP transferase domain-containing protein [bacterium]|nr:NTP transferase domain-containing protein [bacterium]